MEPTRYIFYVTFNTDLRWWMVLCRNEERIMQYIFVPASSRKCVDGINSMNYICETMMIIDWIKVHLIPNIKKHLSGKNQSKLSFITTQKFVSLKFNFEDLWKSKSFWNRSQNRFRCLLCINKGSVSCLVKRSCLVWTKINILPAQNLNNNVKQWMAKNGNWFTAFQPIRNFVTMILFLWRKFYFRCFGFQVFAL